MGDLRLSGAKPQAIDYVKKVDIGLGRLSHALELCGFSSNYLGLGILADAFLRQAGEAQAVVNTAWSCPGWPPKRQEVPQVCDVELPAHPSVRLAMAEKLCEREVCGSGRRCAAGRGSIQRRGAETSMRFILVYTYNILSIQKYTVDLR